MNFFKRFISEPVPTPEEVAAARAFKNILKYGEDLTGAYKAASEAVSAACKAKSDVEKRCEEFVIKDKKLKLKTGRNNWNNWSSVCVRSWQSCTESPIRVCITVNEFGSENPYKDLPQDCLYCGKEFK